MVEVGYASERMSVERVSEELWRAATNTNQGGIDISIGLASPVVAECLGVAVQAATREEAAASAGLAVAFSGQASLAADLAQRAAVRSVGMEGDRARNFAVALFSEASNYLVSRDLPGFVGPGGRAQTVGEAIRLKSDIRSRIEGAVAQGPPPPGTAVGGAWGDYVRRMVSVLSGKPEGG